MSSLDDGVARLWNLVERVPRFVPNCQARRLTVHSGIGLQPQCAQRVCNRRRIGRGRRSPWMSVFTHAIAAGRTWSCPGIPLQPDRGHTALSDPDDRRPTDSQLDNRHSIFRSRTTSSRHRTAQAGHCTIADRDPSPALGSRETPVGEVAVSEHECHLLRASRLRMLGHVWSTCRADPSSESWKVAATFRCRGASWCVDGSVLDIGARRGCS